MTTALPDFDTLMTMAQTDPVGFEKYRSQLLQGCVDDAPPEHRAGLSHLVFRMNQARETAATPLEAATRASELMNASATNLRGALEHLQYETAGLEAQQVLKKLRS